MREYSNNEQWWMNDSVLRETKKYDIFFCEKQNKYVCERNWNVERSKWRWHQDVYMSNADARFGMIVLFSEKLGVEHICRTSCVWQGSIPVEMFHYWGK